MISFTIAITKEFIQQQRWFQVKFYSISKQKHCRASYCKYRNLRKAFLQKINFEVGDSVLLTSWITELPNKRIRSFKEKKPMKDTKGERQEIHSIQAEII